VIRNLKSDESGMAMALAVIMIALFSVMGAGLLVFATSDLGIVVDANRGQRAFEMADAGVQAAKRQLDEDSSPSSYNGGSDDSEWSATKDGAVLRNLDPSSATDHSATVTIENCAVSDSGCESSPNPVNTFKVVSTGEYGPAMRRIEATFRIGGGVGIPPTYFSRTNTTYSGTADAKGISLFSRGNIDFSGAGNISNDEDAYFRRWASHPTETESYPNIYNRTARTTDAGMLGGAGALGEVTGLDGSWDNNRVFDGTTSVRMMPNWEESSRFPSQKISFPFDTSRDSLDEDIDELRRRAQELEARNPGYDYYRQNPTDLTIDDWPPVLGGDDTYENVVFYEFSSYNGDTVTLGLDDGECPTNSNPSLIPTNQGVIVVVNGDFFMSGSSKFAGGVIAYTGSDNVNQGTFTSRGSACLVGYAHTTGRVDSRGTPAAGSVPALDELESFNGSPQMIGWRELYD
jgi:hypothetical protein